MIVAAVMVMIIMMTMVMMAVFLNRPNSCRLDNEQYQK
jgi:hypothetical protein